MSLTVQAGQAIPFDPSDERVIQFDWNDVLPVSASISTSTFTIDAIIQKGATALSMDNASIITGNRAAQVRLKATTATDGDEYWVNDKIVTNETPAQTFERRVRVVVRNR